MLERPKMQNQAFEKQAVHDLIFSSLPKQINTQKQNKHKQNINNYNIIELQHVIPNIVEFWQVQTQTSLSSLL